MWLITTATIFVTFYILLVRIFRVGWKSMDTFRPQPSTEIECKISVVVACRNEEKSLPKLLDCLSKQTYQNFEIVLVNDHSSDGTQLIMSGAKDRFSDIKLILAKNEGKKSAIAEGILSAAGKLIITTDADCEPGTTWIETIGKFQTENPSDLIICPVKLNDKGTFFSRLQQFEFISLVASGAGAAGAHYPIMCNAANMAFTKDAWTKSQMDLKPNEQSGDDIFLLQSVKKRNGIIQFLYSKKAFVTTEVAENTKAFIKQRRRWAGKSTAYTDIHLVLTACTVLGVNLALISMLIGGIFNVVYFYFFLFFFALKYWSDTQFLNNVSGFFSLSQTSFYSFCLSVIYPFYIVFTGISALIYKPKKWE